MLADNVDDFIGHGANEHGVKCALGLGVGLHQLAEALPIVIVHGGTGLSCHVAQRLEGRLYAVVRLHALNHLALGWPKTGAV